MAVDSKLSAENGLLRLPLTVYLYRLGRATCIFLVYISWRPHLPQNTIPKLSKPSHMPMRSAMPVRSLLKCPAAAYKVSRSSKVFSVRAFPISKGSKGLTTRCQSWNKAMRLFFVRNVFPLSPHLAQACLLAFWIASASINLKSFQSSIYYPEGPRSNHRAFQDLFCRHGLQSFSLSGQCCL